MNNHIWKQVSVVASQLHAELGASAVRLVDAQVWDGETPFEEEPLVEAEYPRQIVGRKQLGGLLYRADEEIKTDPNCWLVSHWDEETDVSTFVIVRNQNGEESI